MMGLGGLLHHSSKTSLMEENDRLRLMVEKQDKELIELKWGDKRDDL
jgi:hypothetical protein